MEDMVVCKWSSIPLLRRVVGLHGLGALHDGVGLQHHVASEAVDVQLALNHQMLPFFTPSTIPFPSSPGKNLDTRTEPV